MSKINFLKPDNKNLSTYLYSGSFLFFIAIFDVFLGSFFKITITSFLPNFISFLLPLILGIISNAACKFVFFLAIQKLSHITLPISLCSSSPVFLPFIDSIFSFLFIILFFVFTSINFEEFFSQYIFRLSFDHSFIGLFIRPVGRSLVHSCLRSLACAFIE